MKFIIEDKIYDTETSEQIIEYRKSYPFILFNGHKTYIRCQTTLYRTKKGNWFSLGKGDYDKYTAQKETDESVKEILKKLDEVDIYNKYFDNLEEA